MNWEKILTIVAASCCICLIGMLIAGFIIDVNTPVTDRVNNNLSEWVSPDGVHYWVYSRSNKCGITPRYDASGELVVDHQ